MIAKATAKGKSFQGIVNYLFKGRLAQRGKQEKQAKILRASSNLELPYNHEDEVGISRLIKNFTQQTKHHKGYQPDRAYVGHHILSFSQDDIRLLNSEDINAIVVQYIQDSGLQDTQYIAVSHEDTDDYHLHLVFNRCMNNRKLYDDSWEKIRAIEKAVALNLKQGLPLKGKQHEVAKTSGVWEFRMQHEDIQELAKDPLLKNIRNMHHFKKVCETANQQIIEDEKTVKVGGKSYRKVDLEAVFFKNRREMAKEKGFTTKKVHYKATPKDKSKEIPEYQLKRERYETQQEEKNTKKQTRKQESSSSTVNLSEQGNEQRFNYKKSWSVDEDEFLSKKRRRRI